MVCVGCRALWEGRVALIGVEKCSPMSRYCDGLELGVVPYNTSRFDIRSNVRIGTFTDEWKS
jgi:hypothetical protein